VQCITRNLNDLSQSKDKEERMAKAYNNTMFLELMLSSSMIRKYFLAKKHLAKDLEDYKAVNSAIDWKWIASISSQDYQKIPKLLRIKGIKQAQIRANKMRMLLTSFQNREVNVT
jgi:hypothetical protein